MGRMVGGLHSEEVSSGGVVEQVWATLATGLAQGNGVAATMALTCSTAPRPALCSGLMR